jgi:hypothetical protein
LDVVPSARTKSTLTLFRPSHRLSARQPDILLAARRATPSQIPLSSAERVTSDMTFAASYFVLYDDSGFYLRNWIFVIRLDASSALGGTGDLPLSVFARRRFLCARAYVAATPTALGPVAQTKSRTFAAALR